MPCALGRISHQVNKARAATTANTSHNRKIPIPGHSLPVIQPSDEPRVRAMAARP
jgi:hypothetical protein